MKVKVKALINFKDMEANKDRVKGEEFICTYERAEYLRDNSAIEILEELKEEKKTRKSKK